jgi:hypothetical protein
MSLELPGFTEYSGGCSGKAQRQFRGKCLVGLAAYPVCPEESAH